MAQCFTRAVLTIPVRHKSQPYAGIVVAHTHTAGIRWISFKRHLQTSAAGQFKWAGVEVLGILTFEGAAAGINAAGL